MITRTQAMLSIARIVELWNASAIPEWKALQEIEATITRLRKAEWDETHK